MSENYEVGHGKPPVHSRFGPGQSGNPHGKRKGSRSKKTIVAKLAAEKHKIRMNGESRTLTLLEVLLLKLKNMAMSGNLAAIKFCEETAARLLPELDDSEKLGYLIVPEAPTPEEFIEKCMEHDKRVAEMRAEEAAMREAERKTRP